VAKKTNPFAKIGKPEKSSPKTMGKQLEERTESPAERKREAKKGKK
jgi:hypothetical protein